MKSTLMTNYVNFSDIDLIDKLANMLESEISEEIYNKCKDPKTFAKIGTTIWNLLKNSAEPFHSTTYFDGLEGEYEPSDEHDKWATCLYNCDLIYMVAIASVLKLQRPKTSNDVSIFGL